MKRQLLAYLFILLFWPTSLFLSNTKAEFLNVFVPSLLIFISYFMYRQSRQFYLFPILIIPIFQPKLALLPVIIFIIYLILHPKSLITMLGLILAILMFVNVFKPFWGQTIFHADYEGYQRILRQSQLYPNVILARVFQNKGYVYADKFISNFFILTDPNNYFFQSHPREIILDNQNLKKYPALAIVFALTGILYFYKNENRPFILLISISGLLSLSVLTFFDRSDILLWIPISTIIIYGIHTMSHKLPFIFNLFLPIFLIYSLLEYIQIFFSK